MIDEAQKVEEFEDEVELEETVVEFDIQEFFAQRGLGTTRVNRIE